MKHLFIFLVVLTAFCAPVFAQDAPADPAAYLSAQTAAYLEIRSDDASLAAFDQQVTRLAALSSVPAQVGFTDLLTDIFPAGVNFRADVLPWLADRFAVAFVLPSAGASIQSAGTVFVLPIADANGARAFVQSLAPRVVERDVLPNNMMFYFGGVFSMAVNDAAIWLGSPASVKPVLPGASGTLAQNPAYQQVRAALPADALASGYLNGAAISEAVAEQQPLNPLRVPPNGVLSADVLWETIWRLHPAQSPAEDALLQFPPLNGAGFAFGASADRLDLTAALSLDASYPAPTLATATAGAALLDLIPGDSFVTFASYDVSLVALPTAGLALLGPTVGSVFTSIVTSLDGTPPPTPISTPTPPAILPLYADGIIAQAQPFVSQAQSLMGMSLDELYGLIGGEYAVAVFPGAGPTIGAALYLYSPDPQRILDTLDHVSGLILTDPANGTPLVAVEHQTIDGVDVSLLGTSGASERPALGLINENVLFLTMETTVSRVIASASQTAPSPALDWRAAFGDGQEALFYLDPRTIDLYSLGRQRIPPLPVTAVAGSLDARADGLFVLNLTMTVPNE